MGVAAAFDAAYLTRALVFGRDPDRVLAELALAVRAGGRVLDLGAGDGRNACYLARQGLSVEAVDLCPRAVRQMRLAARHADLPLTARQMDLRDWRPAAAQYDLIVADTVLCHLPRAEVGPLARRIVAAMQPGAWLYASAFATDDPRESEFAPLVQTYFTATEWLALFGELQVERCRQARLIDTRHGPPHRHALLQLVARKPVA